MTTAAATVYSVAAPSSVSHGSMDEKGGESQATKDEGSVGVSDDSKEQNDGLRGSNHDRTPPHSEHATKHHDGRASRETTTSLKLPAPDTTTPLSLAAPARANDVDMRRSLLVASDDGVVMEKSCDTMAILPAAAAAQLGSEPDAQAVSAPSAATATAEATAAAAEGGLEGHGRCRGEQNLATAVVL